MKLLKILNLDKNKKHNIEIVVDRYSYKEGIEERLADSIETVLKLVRRNSGSRCSRWRRRYFIQ